PAAKPPARHRILDPRWLCRRYRRACRLPRQSPRRPLPRSLETHETWGSTLLSAVLQDLTSESFPASQRRVVNLPARSLGEFRHYFEELWNHVAGHFLRTMSRQSARLQGFTVFRNYKC